MSYFLPDLSPYHPREPWILELHHAADRNDVELLKAILSREEERSNGRLSRGEWKKEDTAGAPLHHAARHGHDHIMQLLIDAGVDVNSYELDEKGNRWTALHDAVLGRHTDTVRALLYYGADPKLVGHHKTKHMQGTPLDWAVLSGISARSDIVHMLEHFMRK